jgi:hypothetical protein
MEKQVDGEPGRRATAHTWEDERRIGEKGHHSCDIHRELLYLVEGGGVVAAAKSTRAC